MKAGWIVTLVMAGAAPVAAVQTHGFGLMSDSGDLNLTEKAQEIADKEFHSSAKISVVSVSTSPTRIGAFGETIKADPGYEFDLVKIRVVNDGKMDLAVSGWQFSANDTEGSDHHAELGGAHEDFDGGRLAKGSQRIGTVTFQLPKGDAITGITWIGDLAEAHAEYRP